MSAASAALEGVCSSIGHRGRGFEGLKVGAASVGMFCSSIGHRDRGFESLKGCAASAALGFGRLFRVANALRGCLLIHRSS